MRLQEVSMFGCAAVGVARVKGWFVALRCDDADGHTRGSFMGIGGGALWHER